MEEIKKGDVVWLKSGSPAMTVVSIYSNTGNCECNYFLDGKLIGITLHKESVTKKQPDFKTSITFSTPKVH